MAAVSRFTGPGVRPEGTLEEKNRLIWPWHQPWQAGTRDMHTSAKGAQHRPNPSEVGGREYRRVPLRERESNPRRAEDERCAQGSA